MLSRIVTEEDPIDDENDDPQYQLEYFDKEEKMWMNLPKAAPCAGRSCLVVAGRTLYTIKSSRDEVTLPVESFQYHAEQNMWKELSPMIEPHGTAPLVLCLDGYICL